VFIRRGFAIFQSLDQPTCEARGSASVAASQLPAVPSKLHRIRRGQHIRAGAVTRERFFSDCRCGTTRFRSFDKSPTMAAIEDNDMAAGTTILHELTDILGREAAP